MEQNKAAQGALETYLGMQNPGYAILIDAPWGTGKTHFAKRVCEVDSKPKEVRYVTLDGVADVASFRRALLKGGFEADVLEKAAKAADAAAKILKLGNLGTLARDIAEERFIENLPGTLIFDDIERSTLEPAALHGLINEFIEHKQKRVVLLVHSDKHPQREKFLEKKEKIVGRTIHIAPDFRAAYPEFVSLLNDGKGRKYFTEGEAVVQAVFGQARHGNLRLLRNAIRDCAILLDQMDDDLFLAKEPMARFVRTYIALSMALSRGDITEDDIGRRDNWHIAVRDVSDKDEIRPLQELRERHEGADIYASGGSVLSLPLGEELFVKGYIGTEALNQALRATHQFSRQGDNPLWRNAVQWGRLSWRELKAVVRDSRKYLFERREIEPGPYLHIADNLLRIQEYGGMAIERDKLVEQITSRIEALTALGGIPAASVGVGFGWDDSGRHFLYGGYGVEPNSDFQKVLQAMRNAQITAYEASVGDIGKKLLSQFRNDLDGFCEEFTHSNEHINFYRGPILHHLDVKRFSEIAMGHLKLGRVEELGKTFDALSARRDHTGLFDAELGWVAELRSRMEAAARSAGPFAQAQLAHFLAFHWKFRSPDGAEAEEDEDV